MQSAPIRANRMASEQNIYLETLIRYSVRFDFSAEVTLMEQILRTLPFSITRIDQTCYYIVITNRYFY